MLLTSLTAYSEQNIHNYISLLRQTRYSNYGSATTQYFDRSTLFMNRLNAGNVEKLTVSNGRPFQMFMTRSEKNSDLAVQ